MNPGPGGPFLVLDEDDKSVIEEWVYRRNFFREKEVITESDKDF